jgi:acetoin:2,6-dichlorophenolindophenol oxidoreductase subunit beta
MPRQRMIQAINDALREEMTRDPSIVLFGEDVRPSIFGDTRGLLDAFGPERVRDTPICETLMTGMAIGAAATGARVVCHLMFANFLYTGFDAIANQAAKLRYMTNGQIKLPLVFMASASGGRASAAQHSDSAHPLFMNLGGLYVATPATPADAKGMMKAALRGDNPVIYLVPGARGGTSGDVPEGEHLVPPGRATIHRSGEHLTLVAIGTMVLPALQAAETLAGEGIEVEIVDPRWLVPLDATMILHSVAKTGHLVIADEARDSCSAASQIAAIVADRGFDSLRAPVRRVTVPDVAIPYSPPLEKAVIPSAERIASVCRSVLRREAVT